MKIQQGERQNRGIHDLRGGYSMKTQTRKTMAAAVVLTALANTAAASLPMQASAAYGVGGNGTAVMEYLDRGIYAVKSGNGMFVSWRYNANDADDAEFRLYRDGKLIYTSKSGDATCYQDNEGSSASKYRVDCVSGGKVVSSEDCRHTSGSSYFDIKLDRPGSQYSPNDCAVGDVDGDGQYEIFLKWDPSNQKDNSQEGKTDKVFIDCYTLEGKKLWRIDLGQNIRAGQHYTQLCVADFDCDGKAELITKTADGTKDGAGKTLGDGSKNYANGKGYILDGPEYLSLFDGQTGKCLDTIDFPVPRGKVSDWGDNYGNRVDRFNGGIAYLDGVHPSAIYGRGYYTRLTWSAIDVSNKKLVKRWIYDSGNKGGAYGDGNHNVMAADVDNDGKQEIFTGAACIDDNGKLLWSNGRKHGDAMHLGDLDPGREGLEAWVCHESTHGMSLLDAKTGKILYHIDASGDTGRCCADNIWAGNKGAEFWGAANNNVYNAGGNKIAGAKPAQNFLIYWDGDLEREVLDGTKITKMTGAGTYKGIFTAADCGANNGTKNNPCISVDLFGDWREELILRTSDNNKLRIWCTTDTTKTRLTTLMHDMQYRAQAGCEQSCYNQPPHVSYYLGSDAALPARPNVKLNNTPQQLDIPDVTGDTTPNVTTTTTTQAQPVDVSGKFIRSLTVLDSENQADWVLSKQAAEAGSPVFGDRDYTYTVLPDALRGAEVISSACDSKNTDAELAKFTAGGNIDAYVLLDNRVEQNGTVPAWLSGWTKTGFSAETSNDVVFSVYQKAFTDGEIVTLGTNGMSGNVVNYTVMVKETAAVTTAATTQTVSDTTATTSNTATATTTVSSQSSENTEQLRRGDVNCDGIIDVTDAVQLARVIAEDSAVRISEQGLRNADCNADSMLSSDDTIELLKFISKLIPSL